MSTLQNGIANRPQVFDGEGTDPQDFNGLSTGSRLYVNDLILSAMMRLNLLTTSPIGAFGFSECPPIFSFEHSGAPRSSTAARGFTCNAGPIFQTGTLANVGAIDGVTPKIKSYFLTQGEISGQFAVADPTNPRFDAIYLRVTEVDGPLVTRDFEDALGHVTSQSFVTTKQAQLEWQVVQGTAAAIPLIGAAPDATWSLWGAWWIPAAFPVGQSFALQNIFDFRYPLGVRRHAVLGPSITTDPSGWTYNASSDEWASASGSHYLLATCPLRSGRILGANWSFLDQPRTNDFNIQIAGRGVNGTGFSGLAVPAGGPNEPNFNLLLTEMNRFTLRGGLWISGAFPLTPANAKSPTNHFQLLPLWANGFGSTADDSFEQGGGAGFGTSLGGSEQRRVRSQVFDTATGSTVSSCIFDIAGGI